MGVMRPRPPASQGLRAANTARDKDLEQFRRSLSVTQVPKPVAAGGISGVTRCDAVDYAASSSTMQGIDWTFSSLDGSPGAGVSGGADPNAVYVAAEGYYMATLNYNVSWTSAPTGLAANITFTGDDVDYPTEMKPLSTYSAGVFYQSRLSFSSRWVLLPAGGWFRASLGWVSGPSVGSFHHFTLDITKG